MTQCRRAMVCPQVDGIGLGEVNNHDFSVLGSVYASYLYSVIIPRRAVGWYKFLCITDVLKATNWIRNVKYSSLHILEVS